MNEKIIKDYLLQHEETLIAVVDYINRYDYSLSEFAYERNDEEFFEGIISKYEVARAISYGDYRFNDDYVKTNVYGNLISKSEYDVIQEMKEYIDEIVDRVIELKDKLDIYYDDEFKKIIEEC